MTEFRVLGPLEVMRADRSVTLPPGKPSAVLARLLLDPNRVVPVDAIVDGLWDQRPPVSARKLVQVYVSKLRAALGHACIETRAPGYRIVASADECDLGRFEELTRLARNEPDAGRRAALLEQALARWRGPALAEFRGAPFAVPAARRLTELRLTAVEDRIDADLELGRHERVIGELEGLVAEEPLRERPRRQLMIALYRSGRYAEALASYREARRLLIDDLGIEPGPALQDLERAILRRDPALERTRSADVGGRGPVVCTDRALLALLGPLCVGERELVLVELVAEAAELTARVDGLETVRKQTAETRLRVRTAAFTSEHPARDLARLASEQQAELLVVSDPDAVPDEAPCDVALAPRSDLSFAPSEPVLIPFGGRREEWAAL